MMGKITLYSDGACSPNPGVGGYGAIMIRDTDGTPEKFSKGFKSTTNNRMELLGVIEPLENLKESCEIVVITDSQYVANAVNQGWINGWVQRNWKTASKKDVKNQDLWARMIHLLNKHDIKMQWVRGHNEHPENEECDKMAVEARQREALFIDEGYTTESNSSETVKKLEQCKKDKHSFIRLCVYNGSIGPSTVWWCEVCGSAKIKNYNSSHKPVFEKTMSPDTFIVEN